MNKINYKLNIDDFLNYQEYIVKNKKDKSLNNMVLKWKIFILIIMTLILPVIIYLIFKNTVYMVYMMAIGLIISIYNWIKGEKIWWKDNKKKMRELNIANSFKDEDTLLNYSMEIIDNRIIIERENNDVKEFNITDLVDTFEDNNYIILYFKNGGTIIPKNNLEKSEINLILNKIIGD